MITMLYALMATMVVNGATLVNNAVAFYGNCENPAFYYATITETEEGFEIVDGPHFEWE